MAYSDNTLDNVKDTVNAFAEYFSSVYFQSNPDLRTSINLNVILAAIRRLKPTAVIDIISSFPMKDYAHVFADLLHYLFNLILKKICIDILSNFSKIFEVVLYDFVLDSIKLYLSAY